MIITASMLTLCMASTAWHESRDQGLIGMSAVMEVVHHRAKARYRGSNNECEVAKAYKQFSAFNNGYSMPAHEQSFLDILPLAWKVYRGKIDNLPDNVLHYHTTSSSADWAEPSKVYSIIGDHIFYVGIK